MENENVFNENVEYLKSALEDISTLDKMKKALETLTIEEKRVQKAIQLEEKSIQDEIDTTLKQRKQEIAKTYDKELEANEDKVKRLQAKRNKQKNQKMNERVDVETADVKEDNRILSTQLDTLFKQKKTPAFCKSNLYYSLFMTKGMAEFFIALGVLLLCCGLVPAIISYIGSVTFLKGIKYQNMYFAFIFLIAVIVVFFIYILILNTTKVKHYGVLKEGRQIKEKIKANHKKINAITNVISKDKDESAYELDGYDEKLAQYKLESAAIAENKQAALTTFENDTQKLVAREIQDRRMPALDKLKQEYKDVEMKSGLGEDAIKELTLVISTKYETYLGKEFIRPDKLTDLITIMDEGDAETVSEAIAFYKA